MKKGKQLRDLLYLDFEKAASIWSQIDEGLLERVSVSKDSDKALKAGVSIGLPKLADATIGTDFAQKRSVIESKLLHHDILNRIDEALTARKLVIDLNEFLINPKGDSEKIRQSIEPYPYLQVSGASVIEDYSRILNISQNFNQILEFLDYCNIQTSLKSPEYAALEEEIESKRLDAKQTKNKQEQSAKWTEIKRLEAGIKKVIQGHQNRVDDKLLTGIAHLISTLMPNRINFRVYPYPDCPDFQVICNLKRECFVDQDSEHLLYGYGNRPNVPMTVFGLLTSIPPRKEECLFDPMTEFLDEEKTVNERVAFEEAFRKLFKAMEDFEAFVRYSRYPNVTVHPIAVFRSFNQS